MDSSPCHSASQSETLPLDYLLSFCTAIILLET
ncbi:unnamed protein product [Schistosoma curassoni]|uniref:Uncharacterized protein n=1 Tax=Schistosoma curassoni TaxID=6186 RepID=A0A183K1U6_9TREM|nr:unnamed protein product [Schistosoma curassoni]